MAQCFSAYRNLHVASSKQSSRLLTRSRGEMAMLVTIWRHIIARRKNNMRVNVTAARKWHFSPHASHISLPYLLTRACITGITRLA